MEVSSAMTDPSEKYRNKLDPEHKAVMDLIIGAYYTIKMVETHLRKLDESERFAHSIGHITDPTLYKDMISSKSFADQMHIVRAALKFIGEVDELIPNEPKERVSA
jgi:hypothetical protein